MAQLVNHSFDTPEVLGSILLNATFYICHKSHGHVIYALMWKVRVYFIFVGYFGHVMHFLIGKVEYGWN